MPGENAEALERAGLVETISEGFKEVKDDLGKSVADLETRTKEALEEARMEFAKGIQKAESLYEDISMRSARKAVDIFKEDGMFKVAERWINANAFFRAAAAEKGVPGARAAKEFTTEMFRNWQEEKALSVGSGTAGGNLVPDPMNDFILELLNVPNKIMAFTTRVSSSNNSLLVPYETTEPAGSFVAEAGDIESASTDPAWGQANITMYDWCYGVKMSNQLLADNVFNLAQYLTRKVGQVLQQDMQKYIISGTGSSQPYGITTATAGTVDQFTAAGLAYADLLAAFTGLTSPYADSAIWGITRSVLGTILGLTDAGSHLIFPGGANTPTDTILGRPYIDDANWDANDVDFVDPRGYIFVDRALLEFFVSEHTYANTNQTYFRFIRRWGGQYLRTAGYYKLNSS